MHLLDILRQRVVPGAGLFMALTRRSPLSCAHCSTNSRLTSEEHPPDLFIRFVDSFTATDRPNFLMLTGGEPLLRPDLVRTLTEKAQAVGTSVSLISGMFFARQPLVPPAITRAIAGVDHFTASLDFFHEQEVSRSAVFRVLEQLLEMGKDVSLQVVGLNETDPYLAEVTSDVTGRFGTNVPVFVARVGAIGRAADWLESGTQRQTESPLPEPCVMAAWPVIGFDGTIVACCNQRVIDGPVPEHLRVGHASVDGWEAVRERVERNQSLRAIRLYGPEYIAYRYGSGRVICEGYCETCHRLGEEPEIAQRLEQAMERPAVAFLEEQITRLQQENGSYGIPAYAHLAQLGYKSR